jgi:serine/threonine protein kinase
VATIVDSLDEPITDAAGTPAYMAPEVIKVGNFLQDEAKKKRGR